MSGGESHSSDSASPHDLHLASVTNETVPAAAATSTAAPSATSSSLAPQPPAPAQTTTGAAPMADQDQPTTTINTTNDSNKGVQQEAMNESKSEVNPMKSSTDLYDSSIPTLVAQPPPPPTTATMPPPPPQAPLQQQQPMTSSYDSSSFLESPALMTRSLGGPGGSSFDTSSQLLFSPGMGSHSLALPSAFSSSPYGSPGGGLINTSSSLSGFSPGMFLHDGNSTKSISRYRVLSSPLNQPTEGGGDNNVLGLSSALNTPAMQTHSLFQPTLPHTSTIGLGGNNNYQPTASNVTAPSPIRFDLSPTAPVQTLAQRAQQSNTNLISSATSSLGLPVSRPPVPGFHSSLPPTNTGHGLPPLVPPANNHNNIPHQPPPPSTSAPPTLPVTHHSTGSHAFVPQQPYQSTNGPTSAPNTSSPNPVVPIGSSSAPPPSSSSLMSSVSNPPLHTLNHTKELMSVLTRVQQQSQHTQLQHIQSQQQVSQLQAQLQAQMQLSQQLQQQLQLQQQQITAGNNQLAMNQQQVMHLHQLPPNSSMTRVQPQPYISPPQSYHQLIQPPFQAQQQPPHSQPPPYHPHPTQPQQQFSPILPTKTLATISTASMNNPTGFIPQQQPQSHMQHQLPQLSQMQPTPLSHPQQQLQQHPQPLPTMQQQPQKLSQSSVTPPSTLTRRPSVVDVPGAPLDPLTASYESHTLKQSMKSETSSTTPVDRKPTPQRAAAPKREREHDDDGGSSPGEESDLERDPDHEPEHDDDDQDGSSEDNDPTPIAYDEEGNPIPKRKRVAGSSCHQCKTRRIGDELIYCGMSHAKKGRAKKRKAERKCRKKYCNRCLMKFYDEPAPPKPAPGEPNTWQCPGCRGLCSCAACKRTQLRREGKKKKSGAAQLNNLNQNALQQAQFNMNMLYPNMNVSGGMGGMNGLNGGNSMYSNGPIMMNGSLPHGNVNQLNSMQQPNSNQSYDYAQFPPMPFQPQQQSSPSQLHHQLTSVTPTPTSNTLDMRLQQQNGGAPMIMQTNGQPMQQYSSQPPTQQTNMNGGSYSTVHGHTGMVTPSTFASSSNVTTPMYNTPSFNSPPPVHGQLNPNYVSANHYLPTTTTVSPQRQMRPQSTTSANGQFNAGVNQQMSSQQITATPIMQHHQLPPQQQQQPMSAGYPTKPTNSNLPNSYGQQQQPMQSNSYQMTAPSTQGLTQQQQLQQQFQQQQQQQSSQQSNQMNTSGLPSIGLDLSQIGTGGNGKSATESISELLQQQHQNLHRLQELQRQHLEQAALMKNHEPIGAQPVTADNN